MSKRKKKQKRRRINRNERRCLVSAYPVFDPITGEVDIRSFCIEVEARDVPYLDLYEKAHNLMPFGYEYEPTKNGAEVDQAIAILGSPDETEDARLWAMGILGHSPCQKSFEVLSRYAIGKDGYASVARLALSECTSLACNLNEKTPFSKSLPMA